MDETDVALPDMAAASAEDGSAKDDETPDDGKGAEKTQDESENVVALDTFRKK